MDRLKGLHIVIADSDAYFREELYNFILAAGCSNLHASESFEKALDRVKHSAVDIVLLAVDLLSGKEEQCVNRLLKANPRVKVILILTAEQQEEWSKRRHKHLHVDFLIKTTFAQDILYLLQRQLSRDGGRGRNCL